VFGGILSFMIARWRRTIARGATMGYLGIGHQPTALGRRVSVAAYALAVVYGVATLGAFAWMALRH